MKAPLRQARQKSITIIQSRNHERMDKNLSILERQKRVNLSNPPKVEESYFCHFSYVEDKCKRLIKGNAKVFKTVLALNDSVT